MPMPLPTSYGFSVNPIAEQMGLSAMQTLYFHPGPILKHSYHHRPSILLTCFSSTTAPPSEHLAFARNSLHKLSISISPLRNFSIDCSRSLSYMSVLTFLGAKERNILPNLVTCHHLWRLTGLHCLALFGLFYSFHQIIFRCIVVLRRWYLAITVAWTTQIRERICIVEEGAEIL